MHKHIESLSTKLGARSRAVKRLRRAAGQIRGLEKMVEEGKYCIDIINQSLAVKGALSAFESDILENHLKTHVAEQVRRGEKNKVAKEILSIYKVSSNK